MWRVIRADADISGENGWNPKHFWAFVVWNFDENQIQILEITQSSVLNRLQSLVHNEDWGDPREYSITVTRAGEGLSTKYEVEASPHKPTPVDILELYQEKKINLEALFDGKSPFDTDERSAERVAKDFRPAAAEGTPTGNSDEVPF